VAVGATKDQSGRFVKGAAANSTTFGGRKNCEKRLGFRDSPSEIGAEQMPVNAKKGH
jgi:hypothetical protein